MNYVYESPHKIRKMRICMCQCVCVRQRQKSSGKRALSSTLAAVLMYCVIVIDCVSGMIYKHVHGNPAEVTLQELPCTGPC